ncbi:hypothetical protein COL154_007638 [Colletotrichum chrysophilum]|nr:hypothetical protein COL154_007638 [Colletotrichum chrysophilum]
MDDATLQLVLQLQQADLKELRHEARGCNNKDGFLLDADLAFEMYQEELSFLETFVMDEQLSRRFNEEEGADEEETGGEDTDEEEEVGQAKIKLERLRTGMMMLARDFLPLVFGGRLLCTRDMPDGGGPSEHRNATCA